MLRQRPPSFYRAGALLCLSLPLLLSACHSNQAASQSGIAVAAAPPSGAADFLKWSMSQYQALNSFQANCAWSSLYGSTPSGPTIQRTLSYVKPNLFKVVTTVPADKGKTITITSVSDGAKLTSYSNDSRLPAMAADAPLAPAAASTVYMKHPMFGGTLLYTFFSGPDAFPELAQESKQPVSFGAPVTLEGRPCKTVRFYASGMYGKTEMAIGAKDGLVYRIQYGSEPLLEMLRKQGKAQVAATTRTTELYTHLQTNPTVSPSVFKAVLPPGVQLAAAQGEEGPPVPVGQQAPDFQVKTLSGAPVKLSSLRGKVVLLDFWATWCPPCRKGLPDTDQLNQQFGNKGLAVMAISDEEPAAVKPFLQANHYTFPTYLDGPHSAAITYRVNSIPTLVVIDREGKLSSYLNGLQEPEIVREALQKAGLQMNG